MEKLKNTLRQGDRVSAVLIKDGLENQFYIEANPQFKSLNIYDLHFRKVQISSLEKDKKKLANSEWYSSCKKSICKGVTQI